MGAFGESARQLIARASALAQQLGHAQVQPEHFLLCASSALPPRLESLKRLADSVLKPSDQAVSGELVFSAATKQLLALAYQQAKGASIEEEHLVMALLRESGQAVLWDAGHLESGASMVDLLQGPLVALLQHQGVDLESLRRQWARLPLNLMQLRPHLEKAGEATQDAGLGGPELMLLAILLEGGPAAGVLMAELGLAQPEPESPAVARLGQRAGGLSEQARRAVTIAWKLAGSAGSSQVETEHLLWGILTLPGARLKGLLLELDPHATLTSSLPTFPEGSPPISDLPLSPLVERAIELALQVEAAPVGPEYLLMYLAALQEGEAHRLLEVAGVTAGRIGCYLDSSEAGTG